MNFSAHSGDFWEVDPHLAASLPPHRGQRAGAGAATNFGLNVQNCPIRTKAASARKSTTVDSSARVFFARESDDQRQENCGVSYQTGGNRKQGYCSGEHWFRVYLQGSRMTLEHRGPNFVTAARKIVAADSSLDRPRRCQRMKRPRRVFMITAPQDRNEVECLAHRPAVLCIRSWPERVEVARSSHDALNRAAPVTKGFLFKQAHRVTTWSNAPRVSHGRDQTTLVRSPEA